MCKRLHQSDDFRSKESMQPDTLSTGSDFFIQIDKNVLIRKKINFITYNIINKEILVILLHL